MARIIHKDEEAMSMLYDRMSSRVFGIAIAILGDRNAAEEAALEVFSKIWHQAGQFNPNSGSARAWMTALSRNCALDHLRKRRRRSKNEEEHVRQQDVNLTGVASPESDVFHHQQSAHIRKAMKSLKPDQVRVILAAYFEGLSHSQIADRMGKPLGTVKTQIRTSLEILRRELYPSKGELL